MYSNIGGKKMAKLNLKLENQLLTITNREIMASGTVNVDQCTFTFDTVWTGYAKTAVFYQRKMHPFYAVLDSNNTCVIPAGAMANVGTLYMGVFGIKGINTLTSTLEKVEILEGATSGIIIDEDPSDTVYVAIVAQYQAMNEQMALHNTEALKLESDVEDLNESVTERLAGQDQILTTLQAFDVIEVMEDVAEVKEENVSINERLDNLELSSFTIADVSILFTNHAFRITDARVTTKSLVDVYFDSSSFSAATAANITIESCSGYIELECGTTPTLPLSASVVVRSVA
jgi:hypothetical protein